MSRLKELRKYVDTELNKMEDANKRNSAVAHLYAYRTGSYDDHAHKGAELAREILSGLKLTDEAETEMICSAVYHHDDKQEVDGLLDEVLKDADVIHHCMNDLSKPVKEKEKARFEKLCAEFGMDL